MGTCVSYGTNQCYLPSGKGDIPVFMPAKASTLFSDPEERKAEMTYVMRIWTTGEQTHEQQSQVQCPTITPPCNTGEVEEEN